MSAGKLLGLIGAGLAVNELTKGSGSRSANVGDASVNSSVVDLLIERIKTDAQLQSILRGPAGGSGSGGTSVAANLEILKSGLRMSAIPSSEASVGDHLFYVLIGETAGGITSAADLFVKIDISEFYLKADENLVITNDLYGGNRPIKDSNWSDVLENHVIANDRNPDGTPYGGAPFDNMVPQDSYDWSFEGREGDILTYKLGGVRQKSGFGPLMRSAFVFRMMARNSEEALPIAPYSIGVEISGGGLAAPVTGEIVVPPAFYVPLS